MSTSACISTRRHPASPAGLLEIAENSRAHRDGLVLARGSLSGAAGLVAKRMSTASARPSHEAGAASSENGAGTSAKLSRSDSAEEPVVLIIDDDVPIQETLRDLIHSVGLRAEVFGSTAELAARKLPDAPRCLILEVRLPGMSGLDFQAQLARANIHIPIVFVTGYGDISMTVRAMKAGAVDFLTKPFRDQDILDAIAKAIARDRMRRDDDRRAAEMRARFDTLRPREREVMALVTSGLPNKEVAAETDLSEGTVKIHRGRLMKKMGAKSLADLVRMAGILGVSPRVWNLPHNQM